MHVVLRNNSFPCPRQSSSPSKNALMNATVGLIYVVHVSMRLLVLYTSIAEKLQIVEHIYNSGMLLHLCTY